MDVVLISKNLISFIIGPTSMHSSISGANNTWGYYHSQQDEKFISFCSLASHNFVTIPPTGWINAAHRNNVPTFGW